MTPHTAESAKRALQTRPASPPKRGDVAAVRGHQIGREDLGPVAARRDRSRPRSCPAPDPRRPGSGRGGETGRETRLLVGRAAVRRSPFVRARPKVRAAKAAERRPGQGERWIRRGRTGDDSWRGSPRGCAGSALRPWQGDRGAMPLRRDPSSRTRRSGVRPLRAMSATLIPGRRPSGSVARSCDPASRDQIGMCDPARGSHSGRPTKKSSCGAIIRSARDSASPAK